MFNGILTYDESMVCGGSGTKRTVGMTFGTPIPFNELEIFCRNPNLASAQLIALYEDGSSDVILDGAEKDLRWVTATSQNKSLKGFDFVDSNNSASSAIAGIKVDGVLLTDGITLTLAGDKDLDAFVEGDDVYQDSGHTPTTSVITDVAEITAATTYMVGSNTGTNAQLDDLRKTLSSTTPMVECPVDAPPMHCWRCKWECNCICKFRINYFLDWNSIIKRRHNAAI